MNLEELRKEIDKVDEAIVDLLQKRMDISKEIGEIKKSKDVPVKDEEREREILDKVPEKLKSIFNEIINKSKEEQK